MKDFTPSEIKFRKTLLENGKYRTLRAITELLIDIAQGKFAVKEAFLSMVSKRIYSRIGCLHDPGFHYDHLHDFFELNNVNIVLNKSIVYLFSEKFFKIDSNGYFKEGCAKVLAEYLLEHAESISFEYVSGKDWLIRLDVAPELKKQDVAPEIKEQEPVDKSFTSCGVSFAQLMKSLNNASAPSAP